MLFRIHSLIIIAAMLGAAVLPASAKQAPAPDPGVLNNQLFEVSTEVSKTVLPELAYPGDTVSYQITLDTSQSTAGSIYTITDAIPAGLALDPASISVSTGSYAWLDNTLTWTFVAPQAQYDYALTTIDDDPLCNTGYIDLAQSGIVPDAAISGNDTVFSAFTSGAPFDFYGVAYAGLGITDDGIIVFDPATHYAGTPAIPQALPNAAAPNNLLAMLWQDMEIVYDPAQGRGVSLAEINSNQVIVEFDEIQLRSDPSNRYTYELIANRTPDNAPGNFEFIFAYHRLARPITGPLTVGVENADSSLAQVYVNNASANNKLRNPFVVCLDRVQINPPVTLTYTATVTAEPRTTIVNSAIISTDEPGREPENADATLTVGLATYVPGAGQDQEVSEGDSVQFAGSLIEPDLAGVPYPTSITWDFGDGSGASGTLTPTHTYADNGAYTAILTIGDDVGEIASDSVIITVANIAPQVSLGGDASLLAGELFARDGSFTDPGSDIWAATVDYGDGSGPQALALDGMDFALAHTYSAAGVYTLTVTVTDDDGGQGQDAITVSVYAAGTYIPEAGEDQTISEGEAVQFSGSLIEPDLPEVPYPTSIVWDFGDGASASGTLSPTHTYADNGVYEATLIIGDAAGVIGSDTATITVNNVAPAFTLGEAASLMAGELFSRDGTFTDPGSDTWTATVNYGDGDGPQVLTLDGMAFALAHTYTAGGVYTLTVAITDDDGGQGQATLTVTVYASDAYLPYAGEDQSVLEGEPVSFSGSLIEPDLPGVPYPTAITWNFGDGATASGTLTPSHTYADNGDYQATLTITDQAGADTSDTLQVHVVNALPVIDLGAAASLPQNSLFSRSGSFNDPGADSWSATVDYGDGGGPHALLLTGMDFGLQHTYLLPGEYTLTVTVTDDDGGTGIATLNITATGYRLLLPVVQTP